MSQRLTHDPCSFISQSVLQSLYFCKSDKTPKKTKNQCHFFRHVTSGIHWKTFAAFCYDLLQANAMRV